MGHPTVLRAVKLGTLGASASVCLGAQQEGVGPLLPPPSRYSQASDLSPGAAPPDCAQPLGGARSVLWVGGHLCSGQPGQLVHAALLDGAQLAWMTSVPWGWVTCLLQGGGWGSPGRLL